MTFKFNSLYSQLLKEANLFNKQDLIKDLTNFLEELYEENLDDGIEINPYIKNWVLKNYVKWYESSDRDDEKWIEKHEYKKGEPEWAKKDDIYDYTALSNSEYNELNHIIDYFESLDERELNKIDRQPYSVIKQKVEEWDRQLASNMSKNQQKSKEGIDIKTVYKFEDGYSFVKLLSKEEYKKEGDVMGHCVGGYYGSGATIYSLRDTKGESHATLEVRTYKVPGNVHQIKGKQNDKPIGKYIPYIKEFIIKNDFEVLDDGENVGMFYYSDSPGYYFEDSPKWLKIYKKELKPKQDRKFKKIKSKIKNGVHEGDIDLNTLYLKELPEFVKGITVNGDFNCQENFLTSLKNSPKIVNGDFNCFSNRFESLEGGPKLVKGDFDCVYNQPKFKNKPKVNTNILGDFMWR